VEVAGTTPVRSATAPRLREGGEAETHWPRWEELGGVLRRKHAQGHGIPRLNPTSRVVAGIEFQHPPAFCSAASSRRFLGMDSLGPVLHRPGDPVLGTLSPSPVTENFVSVLVYVH
jgi:hypothetical protein